MAAKGERMAVMYKTVSVPASPVLTTLSDRMLVENTIEATARQLGWNLTHLLESQFNPVEERWEVTAEFTRQEG